MTDREAYIALNMMEGLGPIKVRALIDFLGSPQTVFSVDGDELQKVRGIGEKLRCSILEQRTQIDPAAEEEQADALGVRIITPLDREYPEALKTIHDPPLALYVRGAFLPEDDHALGVVGSRKATHYGLNVADRMAYQLAQTGFTVVSGLARGIDTAAHTGALKAKGRTIAVLGAAIDQLYPPENAELADAIAGSGGVVSEYPLGRQADRQTFPYRNRIISGLSMGVLVVEAGAKSGSLHTADAALEQGRSVFAVPGRIDHPAARGTNRLIKNGAKLVDNVGDILEEFELLIPPGVLGEQAKQPAARPEIPLSEGEKKLVETLWQGALDVDSLARCSGMTSAETSGVLLGLEMKRVVNILPGRRVELAEDLRE
ncbi:DNA-processing protein DprA [Tichowtungia aerotolerans]|uniref:DNA-protecting protein DprA n=1 Tax=Tichowtungia aerotolerans TaxID=2697043 RepID=A0A6P1M717_9BACT|nr:DNA-processing protein DprA [Tichowtungia aerotolerans]QHI68813.1 DNA-protecting protein DprA [Tichowtungia aerotolerans]